MKKILFSAIALVMLTACGGGDRQMYFDSNASRIYNDPNAEFDTLSYAVGMNVGLSLKLQNGDFELINDLIMETLEEELNKTEVDYDAVNANSRMMSRFSSERSRPYAMAKRMNAFVQTDRPDTLTLPELYNEEFTREGMSECFGRDIATYVRRMAFPVNTYWMYKAFEDAEAVESHNEIDSVMVITLNDVRETISSYVTNDWKEYNAERTAEWLAGIAKKDGINTAEVDGETFYYRVDEAGDGRKPKSDLDTISYEYEVYTRVGAPVESTSRRIADLKYMREQTENDPMFADSTMRAQRLAQIDAQISKLENLRVTMGNTVMKGMKEAMSLVSVGGEITVWLPSTLAYGDRGNRAVGPNDGVVLRVKLKDVVYVEPAEEGEETVAAPAPGKGNVTIMPAPRPGQKPEAGRPVVRPVPAKEEVK